jgi:hypothetical protein
VSESLFRDLRKPRFWRRLIEQALACAGAEAVLVGLVDIFAAGMLAENLWVVWPGIAVAFAYGVVRAWPRPVETSYQSPKTRIRLVSGDLFDNSEDHLVIGAVDTFDTAPPHISPSSVQGQFLQRVYGNDVEELDFHLETALAGHSLEGTIDGKRGKVKRYPLGTVATLRSQARRFFLVAYSKMDERSSASSTTDGLWDSLSKLWHEVRLESNGRRVRIPMIGGGQSKLSPFLPAQDSVRFMALSFMLASRHAKVCDELVIVARPGEYEDLDHLELQAFFDSLRMS